MANRVDDDSSADVAADEMENLPMVTAAVISLAFGVGMVLLGFWLSAGWLRWSAIGVGVVFILVMAGFLIERAWEKVEAPVKRSVSAARGHVRTDPQLGKLYREPQARAWEGSFAGPNGPIELLIDGGKEPDPTLLVRARAIVAEFPSLERRVATFIAEEAAAETDPEFAAQKAALRISMFRFNAPERPDEVEIVFDGPDEEIWWTCLYVDGELKDLDFD